MQPSPWKNANVTKVWSDVLDRPDANPTQAIRKLTPIVRLANNPGNARG